jgi:Rieske Fe-S protein
MAPSSANQPERRTFLQWVTYGLAAVATLVFAFPFVGFLLGVRKRAPAWQPLGPVKDFPEGETRLVTFDNPLRQPWDGEAAHTGVYVRYEGKDADDADKFLIFAVNCAHLGCPVSWFPQSGLFLCPCHGGVYYANGDRASGPPPRGLFQCEWRVVKGNLEVRAPHYPTLQDPLRDEKTIG